MEQKGRNKRNGELSCNMSGHRRHLLFVENFHECQFELSSDIVDPLSRFNFRNKPRFSIFEIFIDTV